MCCRAALNALAVKNRETKCEGLSLALFVFAIAGNLTYVASILAASTERTHLRANASWLAGSGGTVLLDLIVRPSLSLVRARVLRQAGPGPVLLLPARGARLPHGRAARARADARRRGARAPRLVIVWAFRVFLDCHS